MSLREPVQGVCLGLLVILGGNCREAPSREQNGNSRGGDFVGPVSPDHALQAPPPSPETHPASRLDSPTQGPSSPTSESAPSASPGGRDGEAPYEEDRLGQLVESADRCLEFLEEGALEEAAREIDLLPAESLAVAASRVVREILLRRLERAVAAAEAPAPQVGPEGDGVSGAAVEAPSLPEAGREQDAVKQIEAAWAKDPGNPEASKAYSDLLKKVGLDHYSKGDTERAVSCWNKALAVRPGDPETLRFLERASAVNRKL